MEKNNKHTVIALVQDRPGVLNRVASVFRRRQLNIESVTATRTIEPGVSRMVLVVEAENVAPVVAQLEKLIDVFEVYSQETSTSADALSLPTSCHLLFTQADGVA